jgi:hypothetical protein
MCTGFWWVNLKERASWADPDVNGRIILGWVEGRDVHRFLVGKPEGKGNWGDQDVDGGIMLRWMDGRDVQRVLVGKETTGETQTYMGG